MNQSTIPTIEDNEPTAAELAAMLSTVTDEDLPITNAKAFRATKSVPKLNF